MRSTARTSGARSPPSARPIPTATRPPRPIPAWLPLFDPSTPVAPGAPPLVTPAFPDNPSGHLCATGAIVRALQHFFGRDRVPFSAKSNESGTTRHFARLSDVLREVTNARVWAGIHFRTADIQGAQLGETVARYERRHYFQPARFPLAPRRSHTPRTCATKP